MGSLTQYKWYSSRIENCRAPQHTRLTSSVSCLLLGNISSETGKSCVSTSNQKIQQLTTSTLDLSSTRSSIGVHSNPPKIWRTLPWRIETRNRKTKMKNTIFFFHKLLFVSITNNFSLNLRFNLSYLLLTSQNTNTQCTEMYFHQNTNYHKVWFTIVLSIQSIKQPNGEIMPNRRRTAT